jgi:hypothetical protein
MYKPRKENAMANALSRHTHVVEIVLVSLSSLAILGSSEL